MLRTALGVAGAVLAAVVVTPVAVASPTPAVIGGAQLAGHGVLVNYPAGQVPRLPKVKASAWVIADAGTGQVLAAKDPHGRYRPASTLKVLTAISLIPLLNPKAMVVASKQATTVSPNIVGLLAGHAYKVSDLFTALLTISANDAAMALAQATGSLSHGMADVNAEARHLQADDTVAVTPNGLDAPGQHTSAYDLALFARQGLQMATYPGALGGKIGWTSAAGATYVGMARRHGVTLIVTLLHCPALTEINAAKSLLNWGFAVDGRVRPVGTLVGARQPPAPAPTPSRSAIPARRENRAQSVGPGPSVIVAAGFSGVVLLAAGIGVAYSRRQRARP